MKSGIYKIFNRVTEKFYIGSAVNFKSRWTQHKGKLRSRIHPNKYLQASWDLHGEEAFEFIILEPCEKSKIPEREQYWIDETNCCNRDIGYNLYTVAGSPLGTKWTEERKETARKRMTGFRHTEEAKARMKEIQSSRSKEIGYKISAGKMGHTVSEQTRNKIGMKNSKPDKWPCPDKAKCRCRNCRDKQNEYKRNWNASREILNVQA